MTIFKWLKERKLEILMHVNQLLYEGFHHTLKELFEKE